MGALASQTAHQHTFVWPTITGACLISVDSGGSVRCWTKPAEVVFGYATDDAEGIAVTQLIPFLSNHSNELDGWCRRVDGSVFRGLVATLTDHDASDELTVLVVTDITSRYMREQALARVRERIDAVTTSVAHLAFFSIDYREDELEVWGAFATVMGWGEQAPPRRSSELIRAVHVDDRAALSACFDRAIATGAPFEVELRMRGETGERWLLFAGSLVDGPAPRIVCAGLDITRRRELDAALRASETKLRHVLEATADGVLTIDARGIVTGLNAAARQMFRCADVLITGAHWSAVLDLAADSLPASGTLADAIGRRADGTTFPMECHISAIEGEAGRATIVVLRDVTQHRLLERQVLDVSEQLQRQIGQDLHDGLGQLLTGTAFLAKGMQHGLAAEYQPQAQRIVELINLAIARVRGLARGLSPIHVEAQSLEIVLRSTLTEASELLGVACELELNGYADDALPTTTIAQLCLIAREAITNAVRHGHAQHIVVRLSQTDEGSLLTVEDDGVGIDDINKPLEGLGLRSMRYRAKMIDGQLDIVRTRSGTTVRCFWRNR